MQTRNRAANTKSTRNSSHTNPSSTITAQSRLRRRSLRISLLPRRRTTYSCTALRERAPSVYHLSCPPHLHVRVPPTIVHTHLPPTAAKPRLTSRDTGIRFVNFQRTYNCHTFISCPPRRDRIAVYSHLHHSPRTMITDSLAVLRRLSYHFVSVSLVWRARRPWLGEPYSSVYCVGLSVAPGLHWLVSHATPTIARYMFGK